MVKPLKGKGYQRGSFESVVILDSGKTPTNPHAMETEFESVVILDSGKMPKVCRTFWNTFESAAILDRFSKRRQNLWRLLPPFFCIPRPHCLLTKGAL